MSSSPTTQQVKTLGFSAKVEHFLGEKLALTYAQSWPAYHRWLSRAPEKITAAQGRAALEQHMPELLPTYDTLWHAFGGDEQTGAFLSLYKPPVFRSGCSQACQVDNAIELVRNYDFPSQLCDRLLLHTNWNGTRVIAMTDCLWGVIDGMNEHGLAVSLAYGGQYKHGDGFAITIVLRYILEFCQTTEQAVAVLERVPVHMSYNITLVDFHGNYKTVVICPGEEVQVLNVAFATNHQQGGVIEDLDAIADSYSREQFLAASVSQFNSKPKNDSAQQRSLVELFTQAPLLRKASEWQGWGTLYTARYQPTLGVVELHWPNGQVISQSFSHFVEQDLTVSSPAYL
ncbi:hypothetical protein J7384_13695 [Endozoicomonas sp. G2_1]|uniref:C45 family autoproteolytic acyltransferase/hydolase n=1 Tax=Endozoicomonas sp. G2_1 TaxID=2821091 RepID=UPI001ADC4D9A|nr:C45 family peptidase [Endozoicomonas sp. G2_1]MBO9491415.1 hypothetical protein [Endozoicomonas sp. G2_1]